MWYSPAIQSFTNVVAVRHPPVAGPSPRSRQCICKYDVTFRRKDLFVLLLESHSFMVKMIKKVLRCVFVSSITC